MGRDNRQEYTKCSGTFSNGVDVNFTASFNLQIEDHPQDGLAQGKVGNGYLLNHTQHMRMIYKLMLSSHPVVLTCEHFESRISLLSPWRFMAVGPGWVATPSPAARRSQN